MHSGFFTHVSHTENEVNEIGTDTETCTPEERRRRRVAHEDKKWDEDYYMLVSFTGDLPTILNASADARANYAEDEEIQELLQRTHSHVTAPAGTFQYTETENATMLRLPRKECSPLPLMLTARLLTTANVRPCHIRANSLALPYTCYNPLRVRLRRADHAARTDTRKRVDHQFAHTSILCT